MLNQLGLLIQLCHGWRRLQQYVVVELFASLMWHLEFSDMTYLLGTYGITTGSDSLTLKFITKGQYSTNIGSRTYLMQDSSNYQMFKLPGNEFTFDVDLSKLPCGLNGALYFVSMPQKGQGTPGAKYGTGMPKEFLILH